MSALSPLSGVKLKSDFGAARAAFYPKQTIGPGLDSAPDAPCAHGSGFFNDSVVGLTTRGPPKKKSGRRPAPAMDSGRNDPARGTRAEADTTAGP